MFDAPFASVLCEGWTNVTCPSQRHIDIFNLKTTRECSYCLTRKGMTKVSNLIRTPFSLEITSSSVEKKGDQLPLLTPFIPLLLLKLELFYLLIQYLGIHVPSNSLVLRSLLVILHVGHGYLSLNMFITLPKVACMHPFLVESSIWNSMSRMIFLPKLS